MPLYNFTIRLMVTDLPYPTLEEAKKDCEEWTEHFSQIENCTIIDSEVMEGAN